ncbi:MAG: hypothetical protein P1U89_10880 [Verrucomicrobiales bacterium]|nr:hypothetical protein [Verrucomicrobiales bacterium]
MGQRNACPCEAPGKAIPATSVFKQDLRVGKLIIEEVIAAFRSCHSPDDGGVPALEI